MKYVLITVSDSTNTITSFDCFALAFCNYTTTSARYGESCIDVLVYDEHEKEDYQKCVDILLRNTDVRNYSISKQLCEMKYQEG